MSNDDDDDRPSDTEILLGWDVEALSAAIEEALVRAKTTGEDIDFGAMAAILGVDQDWIEAEHGAGYELEVEIDPELEARLLAECCLDRVNSGGSGESN
jgi:hypothetical protein